MNYFKQIILSLIIINSLLSCEQKKSEIKENNIIKSTVSVEDKQISVASNNEAMNIYTKVLFNKDTLRKNQAKIILLLDKAISSDPFNEMAYANKANVLMKLNNYDSAINVLKKAIELNKDNENFVMISAFIHEKTGDINKANLYYKKAIEIYDEKLKRNPDNIPYLTGKIFAQNLIGGEKFALKEINKLIEDKPENQFLLQMKTVISNFDRKKYIDNL